MATASDLSGYEAALAFLYGRINYERSAPPAYRVQNFKLERMRDLLDRLGQPQQSLPILHIAGTKGKGSTSSMLASILTAAGYRTGLYTSPHLQRTEERLAIDGRHASPEEFMSLLALVRPTVDALDEEAAAFRGPGRPTYFEIMTAMALVHFARSKVDAVVLEVGLGGRLDSTNVVVPRVSVITSISFDHMKQLGHTLGAIAGEKAGIIKPGVPVVTGVTQDEPLRVIVQRASEQNARLYRANVDFLHTYHGSEAPSVDRLPRGSMTYHGCIDHRPTRYEQLELGLLGEHQAANAAVALATIERLQEQGWKIPEEAIRRGLAQVRCAARIEVLRTSPTVVVDTAHNEASIAALIDVLRAGRGFARRHLVFACSRDKNAEGMLQQLWPHFDRVIVTRFINNPRSHTAEELLEAARCVAARYVGSGRAVETASAPEPEVAWRMACADANADDLICVTGSFFLAAELRSVIATASA